MKYTYTPERVCSKRFMIEVDDATRTIRDFQFMGGCPGNLNAVSRLIKGMTIDEVMEKLGGMPVCPGSKVTSCPEQLCKALAEMKGMLDRGETAPRSGFGLNPFAGLMR